MRRTPMCLLCLAWVVATLGGNQPGLAAPDQKEPVYEGKPLSEWISALTETNAIARLHIEKVLLYLGKEAVPALIQALKNENATVHAQAAHILIGFGAQAAPAVPSLIEAVRDRNHLVRDEAAWALGEIGPAAKKAIPDLANALKDPEPSARVSAALALSRLDPNRTPAMVKILIDALNDGDTVGVRSSAIIALEAIGPSAKAAAPQLADLSRRSRDKWDRAFAARALANVAPNPKTVALLIEALKDKDVSVRIYAAMGLHDIGPSALAAVDPLIEALHQDNWNLRKRSAWALGSIGPEAAKAVKPLQESLKDSVTEVRYYVAYALARIDRENTAKMVDLLASGLKDKEVEIRATAAFLLGEIGPPAKVALPQLIEALKDKAEVCLDARAAIKRIAPDTAKRLGIP